MIDAALDMTRITLDVLERTIFTQGVSWDPDALGRGRHPLFRRHRPDRSHRYLRVPGVGPRIGRLRARPAIRFFEEVVGELIEGRRALIASGTPAPRDLLTLLLEAADPETGRGLSDDDVRANIVTFIGAGHETTANTLSWALYLLSQDAQARETIEREVDEVLGAGPFEPRHLEELVYTRAVLDETMRLYPPAPILTRAAIADDQIGDLHIPADSVVTIAPYVLHRHRTLWEDPDGFCPQRFMPGARQRIDRFAYLPFGAGPRVCIGSSFAIQEAVIVLATIVRTMRLDLEPGHVVKPVHRITLRPEGGLPMRLMPRSKRPVEKPADPRPARLSSSCETNPG